MIPRRIRVRVRPGMFQSERSVSFEVAGRSYSLLVDKDDIGADDTLMVYVIHQGQKDALIDLPRDTFTSGSRIRVPNEMLLPA